MKDYVSRGALCRDCVFKRSRAITIQTAFALQAVAGPNCLEDVQFASRYVLSTLLRNVKGC
jgi:hypothetical protein